MTEEIIADRIKKLRLHLNFTQEDLARKCGYSKSFISKIERGNISIAIATLSKIAKVFGVELSWFFEVDEDDTGPLIIKKKDRKPLKGKYSEIGYNYYSLANKKRLSKIQPFVVTIPAIVMDKKPFIHEEEEFVYVISGNVDFFYDGNKYRMEEGDSVYFDGQKSHMFLPIEKEVVLLGVLMQVNY
ncbi:XRE family transcriptional regulator [Neobacillus sp. 114]|uniref:helix-turn-helix domain-containing protein n=1 Tax=Neobacillus sp. 114 TaxID=3048535 RepID=UPI0024C3186D|nr:XRE family transcriptional regulator [Neobacillus sp. 114]